MVGAGAFDGDMPFGGGSLSSEEGGASRFLLGAVVFLGDYGCQRPIRHAIGHALHIRSLALVFNSTFLCRFPLTLLLFMEVVNMLYIVLSLIQFLIKKRCVLNRRK